MSLDKIEHVVVLMLENRSFDSLLGWLYEHDAPAHNIPANPAVPYKGLQNVKPDQFTNKAQVGKKVVSSVPARGVRGFTVPSVDPGEEFAHVSTQFYGTKSPAPGAPISMTGVLEDFVEILKERKYNDDDVEHLAAMCLQSFTPAQLPVLSQLARHYAVCDGWHASVPSQTNPNRAFLMCGTSDGMVNNGDLEGDWEAHVLEAVLKMAIGDDRVDAPTIFNALSDAGVDWTVFWQTSYLPQKMTTLLDGLPKLIPLLVVSFGALAVVAAAALAALNPFSTYLRELSSGELSSSYTWRLFPWIKDKIPHAAAHFKKMDEFHQLARSGKLPKFSYIEPFWSISHTTNDNGFEGLISALGNDYHPPCNMLVGEAFVKEVYTSLISNREAWNKTLLLITFDEFVGAFDHETEALKAGVVKPPWGPNGAPKFKSPTGFKFDRLGARVPAILVSPYVQKNTVFRSTTSVPYDHTSVIATTLKWIGKGADTPKFGERAAEAPTFEGVLTLDKPRTDETDLAFLDTARGAGDLVRWGESLRLRNANGQYLTTAYRTMKAAGGGSVFPESVMGICVDLGIGAWFPRVRAGEPVVLSFVTQSADPPGQIDHNARVMIVSREAALGPRNLLGAWADSHDCYYDDEYLDGDSSQKQKWIVQNHARPNQPLRYGDQVYLYNAFYQGQRLTRDDRLVVRGDGWLTTDKDGDYWTVEPAPPRVADRSETWANAPSLGLIAGVAQGGDRGPVLWGVDEAGQLRANYREQPYGKWSGWSGRWNGDSPVNLISVAAAKQNNGAVLVWAVDQANALYWNVQASAGGGWGGWTAANRNGTPPFCALAASPQGGERGPQLWGIDTSGQLRSTYQEKPGGDWSGWSGLWSGAPGRLKSVTAAQQNDGRVAVWVVDFDHKLYCITQKTPGGDWSAWSPAGWAGAPQLKFVAAAQQGGQRGAALWGVDLQGALRCVYQETPGGGWSSWSGAWRGAPANVTSIAPVQQSDGAIRLWVTDANRKLYSTAQYGAGTDWDPWSPAR